MPLHPTEFIPIHEDENFIIGRLENQDTPGVFLSSEYLWRLKEVIAACNTRLNNLSSADLPDAVKNFVGINERLLAVYREHAGNEMSTHPNADYRAAQEELKKAIDALRNLGGDDDGPKRA